MPTIFGQHFSPSSEGFSGHPIFAGFVSLTCYQCSGDPSYEPHTYHADCFSTDPSKQDGFKTKVCYTDAHINAACAVGFHEKGTRQLFVNFLHHVASSAVRNVLLNMLSVKIYRGCQGWDPTGINTRTTSYQLLPAGFGNVFTTTVSLCHTDMCNTGVPTTADETVFNATTYPVAFPALSVYQIANPYPPGVFPDAGQILGPLSTVEAPNTESWPTTKAPTAKPPVKAPDARAGSSQTATDAGNEASNLHQVISKPATLLTIMFSFRCLQL
jgi:hypothetical protein